MSAPMSPSSSHANSGGFGITLHHEGQTDQNSIIPSQKSVTENPDKQTTAEDHKQKPNINENDIKNNKP